MKTDCKGAPAEAALAAACAQLEQRVKSYPADRLVVAFSGGVDSAVVLATAARALTPSAVIALTALSPSYPAGELEQARSVAHAIGVEHQAIETHEVEKEIYARNTPIRCFHCKTELYTVFREIASKSGDRCLIVSGANADDAKDLRPGLLAAKRYGVLSPLLEEGIGKNAIRAIARHLGLSVAGKPALACLASRVAYGIRVTPELLARIDRAEQAVRALGVQSVRVRHFGKGASIEVPVDSVDRFSADSRLPGLISYLHTLGWQHVAVDPRGLRTGSMNASLTVAQRMKLAPALRTAAVTAERHK